MAGGPSDGRARRGGRGSGRAAASWPAGTRSAARMAEEMAAVEVGGRGRRSASTSSCPGARRPIRAGSTTTSPRSSPRRRALGATLGAPSWDDDDYDAKVDALLADAAGGGELHLRDPRRRGRAGRCRPRAPLVLLTVTTPEEAARALRVGPDALCLQGAEAGAHRGSLANDDRPDQDRPLRALLAAVRPHTLVPLVAAGGVGGPDDVADLLARGADLVQAGTAFLRCPESGAPRPYKEALADPAFGRTAMTRCLQRTPGPGAGQRDGARPPWRTGGLSRDQQRHPAPPGRGDAGRRRPAHEPVRRARPSVRRRPGRSARSWHG